MKKSVTQEHSMGCAVACTAYILERTYEQALKLYENPHNAWETGFYCRDIVIALSKAGKNYKFKRIKISRDHILDVPDIIVFIEKSPNYPAGHFLVRTHQKSWMNPWINFPVIALAQSGFQSELPGKPIYAVFPKA